MMNIAPRILSIQSHVIHGYVGNKAAIPMLQTLGYDVLPINTVQFSNHTGYGTWKGTVACASQIDEWMEGLHQIGALDHLSGILTGYMGSGDIAHCITHHVRSLAHSSAIYLCDPVMGDQNRGVFVKPEIVHFFQHQLQAHIITPNHFEAELLTGLSIQTEQQARQASDQLHDRGIDIVIITSLMLRGMEHKRHIHAWISHRSHHAIVSRHRYPIEPNGTGDAFSALFLGFYLKNRQSFSALESAMDVMQHLLQYTFSKRSRELAIWALNDFNIQKT